MYYFLPLRGSTPMIHRMVYERDFKQMIMENKTIRRTLYKVLRKTGVHRDRIKLDASFNDDLNFDQVDWAIFVFYLEGFFKIHLEDQEIRKMSRVNDSLEMVSKRTSVACL
jgi:acyl carrier protein